MIELSQWLKQVVAIVLVATFAEWLIPDSRMQPYVRVVLGMLVFVTMLSPLLELARVDPLTLSERLEQSSRGNSEAAVQLPSLADIDARAAELAEQHAAQAQHLSRSAEAAEAAEVAEAAEAGQAR